MLHRRSLLAAAALVAVVPGGVLAQAGYPNKPVRLIVPFAPGGTTDIVARVVSEKINAHLGQTLLSTARNTIIHPVVLPVLIGLTWNGLGLPIPTVADEILQTLGQAVVPLCLVLIGMSLAYYGTQGARRHALVSSALKLLVLPALVLAIAHWAFHLSGVALAVVVMMAALPIGSNALIFAQRYRTIEAETTAATVFSTLAFVVTAPLWLAVLKLLA